MTTPTPLVEAQGLTKTYGATRAVAGIDLTVRAGEVFGLLGPNGAGKTTTVLMLLGLTAPDAGTVRVVGLDPARDAVAVKRQVGYLPDTVDFYEDLTGRQNLRYTARLNELEPKIAEERMAELLERVGLADHADRRVGGYSRGMRQRLGLADTLLKDPRVVILDEPMVGIDPAGVLEMQEIITRLARDDGRAVLLTSHMLHQVQQTCDRMAIFVGGRIVAEGTAAELAANLGSDEAVYELVTTDSGERVRETLSRNIDQRVGVELLGANRWRVIVPANSRPILPVLVESGVAVSEFRSLGASLDEIYRRYFTAAEGRSA